MKNNKRPLAVIRISRIRRINDFIQYVKTIVLNIGDHPLIFVTPNPALAGVTTRIEELDAAQTLAETRVTWSAAARDVAYNLSLDDLLKLLAYVQMLADSTNDEMQAISIIEASGFSLKNKGVRVKAPLSIKQLSDSTVKLSSKSAGRKATYYWRKSVDGTAWEDEPNTLVAKTVVTGLTRGQIMYYQTRALTKEGFSTWTASVSFALQ